MRSVRYTTVIWGAVLLVVASLTVTTAVLGPLDFGAPSLVAIVVCVGALLVLVAMVGAITRVFAAKTVAPEPGQHPSVD